MPPTTPDQPTAAVPFNLPPEAGAIHCLAVDSAEGRYLVLAVETEHGVFRFRLPGDRAQLLGENVLKVGRMITTGLTIVEGNGKLT